MSKEITRKYHILLLTSWFPNEKEPYLGNFIEQFAVSMSKRQSLTLLYLDYSSKDKYGVVEQKVSDGLIICRVYVPNRKGILHKYFGHKSAINYIRKNLPTFDLIHAQVGIRDWWHFILTKKALGRPMIYNEHGSYLTENQYAKLSFLKRFGLKRLFQYTDLNTAVSTVISSQMEKVSMKKVEVIGNFVPNSWFTLLIIDAPKDIYRFLHISTLDSNKNPMGILEACKGLLDKGIENWTLTIVSEVDFNALWTWSIANGLEKYISFEKHVPHPEMSQLYRDHDCFVLNSNTETFSIVNAEALCFGLHLISTPVGFLSVDKSEFIDKVQFNSPSDLASKMEDAIIKTKFSADLGREFVGKFAEDKILDKYEELYRRLIN